MHRFHLVHSIADAPIFFIMNVSVLAKKAQKSPRKTHRHLKIFHFTSSTQHMADMPAFLKNNFDKWAYYETYLKIAVHIPPRKRCVTSFQKPQRRLVKTLDDWFCMKLETRQANLILKSWRLSNTHTFCKGLNRSSVEKNTSSLLRRSYFIISNALCT